MTDPQPAKTIEEVADFYRILFERVKAKPQNEVRDDLPLCCDGDVVRLLPATSLAIQSIVPRSSHMHQQLHEAVHELRCSFPELCRATFWQPAGTYHLNVVILDRLRRGERDLERHKQIVSRFKPELDWLESQRAYTVDFRGIIIAPDGTVMAKGLHRCSTPWGIRRRFQDTGLCDQQPGLHVTLGRILHALRPERWKALLHDVETRFAEVDFDQHTVSAPILVSERRGFLHSPECYTVLRRFILGD